MWTQFTSRWHGWNFYRLMNFLTQFTNTASPTAAVFVACMELQTRSQGRAAQAWQWPKPLWSWPPSWAKIQACWCQWAALRCPAWGGKFFQCHPWVCCRMANFGRTALVVVQNSTWPSDGCLQKQVWLLVRILFSNWHGEKAFWRWSPLSSVCIKPMVSRWALAWGPCRALQLKDLLLSPLQSRSDGLLLKSWLWAWLTLDLCLSSISRDSCVPSWPFMLRTSSHCGCGHCKRAHDSWWGSQKVAHLIFSLLNASPTCHLLCQLGFCEGWIRFLFRCVSCVIPSIWLHPLCRVLHDHHKKDVYRREHPVILW